MTDITNLHSLLDWKLLRGSHDWPGSDGGTCINEAAIVAAGKATDFKEGIEVAKKSINSGEARQKLKDLCRLSHS